jgi:hypothetical protein
MLSRSAARKGWLERAKAVVVERGWNFINIVEVDAEETNYTSQNLRQRLHHNQSVSSLMDEQVFDFLKTNIQMAELKWS